MRARRITQVLASTTVLGCLFAGHAHAELGPSGTATMHGDAESADTSPYAGPGTAGLNVDFSVKFGACPTILADSEGMMWALCTKIVGRAPVALLLDPDTGETLASLDIAKGALLGGVYAYLDDQDRLNLVDGNGQLLKLRKEDTGQAGQWQIAVDEQIDISEFLRGSDAVVGLTPDAADNIWLATAQGRVGILRDDHRIDEVQLGEGERIDNSISASQQGVAIATSHALYMLTDEGGPQVMWREEYDRGSARKPGQLSWGTGATPSFFGPENGYVTITDNADGHENLLVYRVADGSQVCSEPMNGATENSAITHGNSVIVPSTYGYPYPATPEGAGPSVPAFDNFSGGMEKFDVTEDGCERVWSEPIASAAVPRLSTVDNQIYTVERPQAWGLTGMQFNAITVDADTGQVTSRQKIADTPLQDSLQMVGTITPDGVWWQGAVTGVYRMSRQ